MFMQPSGGLHPRWVQADRLGGIAPDLAGSYVLWVALRTPAVIGAGRLSPRPFPAGGYAYAGSALGGLRRRLLRYAAPVIRRHWHIDYLLEYGCATGAWVFPGSERIECTIAAALARRLGTVPGFGSSDCRCPSHLFYHSRRCRIPADSDLFGEVEVQKIPLLY